MGKMDGLRPPKHSAEPAAEPVDGPRARPKKNVLFVCIGNICRSPMAEALANRYGSDVLRARSAGVAPGVMPSAQTRKVLAEKNVDLGDHVPTPLLDTDMRDIDLLVNMSGYDLPPAIARKVEEWTVTDPIGQSDAVYRDVRDRIESLVMNLILRIRTGKI
jgi:arsenate reductase